VVSASSAGGLPVAYTRRRSVMDMLGFQVTSVRRRREIYHEILAASRRIEGRCHRYFYPNLTTETFDWPTHQYDISWRMWLDEREMCGAPTQVLSAGTDITDSVLVRPPQGPPYTSIEINLATLASFNSADTYQDAISITGPFGYCDTEESAGELATTIGTTDTVITCTDGSQADAGDTLHIDDERLLVTDTRMVATGATLTADLAGNNGAILVTVSNPSLINVDEYLLIDGERLWVSDITDVLICQRAVSGSVLGAHSSGATVFAERGLVVTRGALGTTVASHAAMTPMARLAVPQAIENWCKAETGVALMAQRTGFAAGASSGMGSSSGGNPATFKPTIGAALDDYRAVALAAFGRTFRVRTADRLI
jgi:hypothetical protein